LRDACQACDVRHPRGKSRVCRFLVHSVIPDSENTQYLPTEQAVYDSSYFSFDTSSLRCILALK
jgi:hypothetical protein